MKRACFFLFLFGCSCYASAQEELSKEAPVLRIRLNGAVYGDYINRWNGIYDSPDLLSIEQITSGGIKLGIDYRTRAYQPLGSHGVDFSLIAGGKSASFQVGIPGSGPSSIPPKNQNEPNYYACQVTSSGVELSPQTSVFYVYGSEKQLEFTYGVGLNFQYQTNKLALMSPLSSFDTLAFIPRGLSGYSSSYAAFHTSAEFFLGFRRAFRRLALGGNLGIQQHLLGKKGYHPKTAVSYQVNIIYTLKQL
ncbi:MAG: hypothetical protein IM638_09860 [Bacteroidetes bacterium]|nr:hypothetical protein [Bacteroidota bacterium]